MHEVLAEHHALAGHIAECRQCPQRLLGSLDDLNNRLPSPLPMNRFRPNIVIDGVDAFEEDGWKRIRIDGIELSVVKPCASG